jgi:hypothetical protein
MNAWKLLFASRKFWLLILDTVISLVTLISTAVLAPAQLDFALKIVAILQPVFVSIIYGIALEDSRIIPANIQAVAWDNLPPSAPKENEAPVQ